MQSLTHPTIRYPVPFRFCFNRTRRSVICYVIPFGPPHCVLVFGSRYRHTYTQSAYILRQRQTVGVEEKRRC